MPPATDPDIVGFMKQLNDDGVNGGSGPKGEGEGQQQESGEDGAAKQRTLRSKKVIRKKEAKEEAHQTVAKPPPESLAHRFYQNNIRPVWLQVGRRRHRPVVTGNSHFLPSKLDIFGNFLKSKSLDHPKIPKLLFLNDFLYFYKKS